MVNPAHWHLLMNHIPVIGIPLAGILLIVAILLKQRVTEQVALCFVVVLGLLTIPVFLTGEPAEELVEEIPTVSHDLIEEHEESAEFAFIITEVLAAIALVGLALAWKRGEIPRAVTYVTLAVAILCSGLLGRVAYLGGHVRHAEIRADWTGGAGDDAEDDEDEHEEADDDEEEH
jgi:DMSO reductase anchor subunit